MRGKVAVDFGKVGNLFEIRIEALVGDYRQHNALKHHFRVVAVFFNQPAGNVEQGDNAQLSRFLPVLAYPHPTISVGGDVRAFERLDVAERQPGERIENYQCNQ